MLDLALFKKEISNSLFDCKITASQWAGVQRLMAAWEEHGDGDDRKLSNVLAQIYRETGRKMQPVREAFAKSDAAAKAALEKAWQAGRLGQVRDPYWRNGWFGRGDIQLTHKYNYELATSKLGVDFVKAPEKALDPVLSATIAIRGMLEGWFTKKKLSDYFTKTKDDPKGARAIVNGKDHAALIAGYHEAFLDALTKARSEDPAPLPTPAPSPQKQDDPEPRGEEEAPNPAAPPPALPDTVLKGVQEKLRQLGYYEVGDPNGVFGDRTKDAVMVFRRRNNLPLSTEIDDQFLQALEQASQKPISQERAEATTKDVAEKAPAVKQTLRARLLAVWGAIGTGVSWLITAIAQQFKDVWDYLSDFRDVLTSVPIWMWLGVAFGACLFIIYTSQKSIDETKDAYRKGQVL